MKIKKAGILWGLAFFAAHYLASAADGGPVVLKASGLCVEVSPEDGALSFALYAPLLWQDVDGDLVHDEGEAFLGSGSIVLAYFSDVNDTLRADGFQPGWNLLRLHMDDSRPTVLGPEDLRMPLNLVVAPSLTLHGVADDTVGEGARIAALASSGESAPEAVIASVDATDTWTLTLEGVPETVPRGPFLQLRATRGLYGLLAAWTDVDASGSYSAADGFLPLCVAGGTEPMSVAAMWVDPVMDGADALFLGFAGLGAGWRAVATEGDAFVPLAEGTGLTASATCFTGPA